jgi:hypothetical protein
MSLLAHLIRTELFRLRWAVRLWIVMVTAAFALQHMELGLLANPTEETRTLTHVAIAILGLCAVFAVFLAAEVALSDPFHRADASRLTRPIPLRLAIGAKASILALLFLGLPSLFLSALLFGMGFGAESVMAALWPYGAVTTATALAVWALASVTGTSRLFLISLGLIFFVLPQLVAVFLLKQLKPTEGGLWCAGLIAVTACGVAILLVGRMRLRLGGAAVMLGGAALSLAVMNRSIPPLERLLSGDPSSSPPPLGAVAVAKHYSSTKSLGGKASSILGVPLFLSLETSGLQKPEERLVLVTASLELTGQGQTERTSAITHQNWVLLNAAVSPGNSPATGVIRKDAGNTPSRPGSFGLGFLRKTSRKDLDRNEPLTGKLTLVLRTQRPVLRADEAVEEGSRIAGPGVSLKVLRVDRPREPQAESGSVTVSWLEHRTGSSTVFYQNPEIYLYDGRAGTWKPTHRNGNRAANAQPFARVFWMAESVRAEPGSGVRLAIVEWVETGRYTIEVPFQDLPFKDPRAR